MSKEGKSSISSDYNFPDRNIPLATENNLLLLNPRFSKLVYRQNLHLHTVRSIKVKSSGKVPSSN